MENDFVEAFELFLDFKLKVEKCVTSEENVEKFKLIALKYELKNSPVFSTIPVDGRATYKSLRRRLNLFFPEINEPCSKFFKTSCLKNSGIDEYLKDLWRKATQLLGKISTNAIVGHLVMQHTMEQFQTTFQSILKKAESYAW